MVGKKFSTAWKESKRPGKQRKYAAEAPLHIKRKKLSANLSKDLRKKYGTRNVVVKKGDTVKIMRGKFKKKQGKILEVYTKFEKIYIDGINKKKLDGSNVNVPLRPSNLQIVELNLEKKRKIGKREGKMEGEKIVKEEVKKPKEKPKKEVKKEKKDDKPKTENQEKK